MCDGEREREKDKEHKQVDRTNYLDVKEHQHSIGDVLYKNIHILLRLCLR